MFTISVKRYSRWENLTRKKKRESVTIAEQNENPAPYGCVTWNPSIGEENLASIQTWLKEQCLSNTGDNLEVSSQMKKTYPLQREMINKKESVHNVLQEWPFLRSLQYLMEHYKNLVDSDVIDLQQECASKGIHVYR